VRPDYGLLELLLFLAIAQRDTKPLKALIAKFGSFADVIAAPVERLERRDQAVLPLPSWAIPGSDKQVYRTCVGWTFNLARPPFSSA